MTDTVIKSWLTKTEHGKFIVDQDKAYPLVLQAMRTKTDEEGNVIPGTLDAMPTKTELETAFQIIKMKVQQIAEVVGYPAGALYVFFEGNPDNKPLWRQDQPGRPTGDAPMSPGNLRELARRVSSALN